MASSPRTSIAHLSDIHVAHATSNLKRLGRLLSPSGPGEGLVDVVTRLVMSSWFERRALGEPLMRSAHLKHRYDPRQLSAVLQSVREQKVDHVILTGDLTEMGAPSEMREAMAALDAFGWKGPNLTLMPGNHDRLNFRAVADFRSIACDRDYPLLNRITDDLFAIAVDSTAWGAELDWRDMMTMNARGRILVSDVEKIDKMLASLPPGAGCILCTHHHVIDLPPDGYVDDWAGKADARLSGKAEGSEALIDVAEARKVRLILFGHRHRATRDAFSIRGIPAACSGAVTRADSEGRLRYRIFEFEGANLVESRWVTITEDMVHAAPPVTAPVEGDDLKVTVKVSPDNLQQQMSDLTAKRKEMDRKILERMAKGKKG
ncbi:MAG: metallophosphoesterase [Deltaproteobacteria bacterium]|nr:metallophosphoesterase [Deltaproteobacteria bacterium]